MGCIGFLKGYMKIPKTEEARPNNDYGNKKEDTVTRSSVEAIECTQTEIGKIEEYLRRHFENVKTSKVETPGINEYWVIGNYTKGKTTYGVFVQVPYEGPNKGKVNVSAARDQIEKLMELENKLGIKLE